MTQIAESRFPVLQQGIRQCARPISATRCKHVGFYIQFVLQILWIVYHFQLLSTVQLNFPISCQKDSSEKYIVCRLDAKLLCSPTRSPFIFTCRLYENSPGQLCGCWGRVSSGIMRLDTWYSVINVRSWYATWCNCWRSSFWGGGNPIIAQHDRSMIFQPMTNWSAQQLK